MPDQTRRRLPARRPESWNALLKKGHVHEAARSSERAAERAQTRQAVDQYWMNIEDGDDDPDEP